LDRGRIKATTLRVFAQGQNRYSVPFFFEPRPSARIAPLPLPGIRLFAPFLYGDHLWATTTKFPENFGLADLRPPRAAYTDSMAV
jgi:isopenicillin N synthase-like dioxygenase